MTDPTQPLDLERMRDDELAEIALHAGMTAEQDDRHKAIFFDSYVLSLLDALSSERAAREDAEGKVCAGACKWLEVVITQDMQAQYDEGLAAKIVESWKARALAAEAQVSALQAEVADAQASLFVARSGAAAFQGRIMDLETVLRPFARIGELLGRFEAEYGKKSLNEYGEHFKAAAALLSQPPADEPAKEDSK